MNKEQQHIDLISAWIDGSITAEERERFHKLVEEGEIDLEEVEELQMLYGDMEQLPTPDPSDDLSKRFSDMMIEAKKKEKASSNDSGVIYNLFHHQQTRRWAAVAAVFVAGLLIGNLFNPVDDYRRDIQQLSSEVSEMREVMMMNLLDDQSSVERLKAVNIGSSMESADRRVIEALLTTLNNDPNVNVRLASIEALVRHGDNPMVRRGLVESISRQQSPQVQVALADAMIQLDESDSVDELRRLLDQEEMDGAVRDKLEYAIAALR